MSSESALSSPEVTGSFDFDLPAELFLSNAHRLAPPARAYRRFDTAAAAIRHVVEELTAGGLKAAILEVDEIRYSGTGIRSLYDSEDYPLPRGTPSSAP